MTFRLNIRRKILLGLLVPAVCLGVITALSYANLLLIEDRIRVLGKIDAASFSIMELRRHGKAFLFFGEDQDHAAVQATAETARDLLREIQTRLLFAESRSLLDDLAGSIDQYRHALSAVKTAQKTDATHVLALKSDAHVLSETMEEGALTLSTAVRERIADISANLRLLLLASALAVFLLFGLALYFMGSHVLTPLKVMERTTRDIARGRFTPVPLGKNRDEIRDLQEAFNSMTSELKRRQDQLVQSQKLSSIGTLSAGIAHQVNNPLNNISLAVQFLREKRKTTADPAEIKAMENIDQETGRARDIVRGLLDFSRQSEFTLRRIRLKTVVNNAVRFASAQLPPGVRLEADVPDDLRLDLDAQRMSEAILNMIINAVQALDEGLGEVRLRMDAHPPQGRVVLIIEDNGKGIAPEDLPHVFDPFFTSKEPGKGTGLGLSVGYGIIEECGGTVRVESATGQGTRFFVELPLPVGDDPPDRREA